MPLRDFLTVVSGISVIKTIQTDDGMGGSSATSSTFVIPLATIWQNGSSNRWLADKYSKDSSHTLAFEWGAYTFGTPDASGGTVIEQVQYNSETYKLVGFQDNVMQLNEISVQALERIS